MGSSKRSKRTSKASAATRSYSERARTDGTSKLRETSRDGYKVLVDDETSLRMAEIRQGGTKPELIVRKLVSSLGHRYRISNRDLPGSPDLANRSRGWAIFVHGCYWHRHRGCKLATTPKRNAEFWLAKFERNVERDRRVIRELRRDGFGVLVVWECETRKPARLLARLGRWLGLRSR